MGVNHTYRFLTAGSRVFLTARGRGPGARPARRPRPAADVPALGRRLSDKLGGLRELMTHFNPCENCTENASCTIRRDHFSKQEPGGRGPPPPRRLKRPVRGTCQCIVQN